MRIAIGLMLCAAAISVISSSVVENTWIPQIGYIGKQFYAVIALATGALMLFGLFTHQAVIAIALLIIAIAVEHLIKNPFYNMSVHLLPLLALTVAVFYMKGEHNDLSLDRVFRIHCLTDRERINSWSVLFLRLFLGAIFFAQGLYSIAHVGIISFARKLYVTPFAQSGIPVSLLWTAGVLNPPAQFIGGLALIAGFMTRLNSVGLGIFLLTIIFGHMIENPFGDIHDFSIANFIVLLAIIFLEPLGNRYSLDSFMRKHGSPDDLPVPGIIADGA